MRTPLKVALVLSVIAVLGQRGLWADEKKPAVDEKAVIEAMMKAGTPGEAHKRLDALVGTWDLALKMWIDPSKPPMEMKAACESKWIMGNRFLEENVTGEFEGAPFQGRSVSGYDNLQKKYVSSWIDNMATGISVSRGDYDSDKKTFTYHREDIDPLTGQKVKGRDVLRIVDKDHLEMEAYKTMGDQEVKVMHIVYTRKK